MLCNNIRPVIPQSIPTRRCCCKPISGSIDPHVGPAANELLSALQCHLCCITKDRHVPLNTDSTHVSCRTKHPHQGIHHRKATRCLPQLPSLFSRLIDGIAEPNGEEVSFKANPVQLSHTVRHFFLQDISLLYQISLQILELFKLGRIFAFPEDASGNLCQINIKPFIEVLEPFLHEGHKVRECIISQPRVQSNCLLKGSNGFVHLSNACFRLGNVHRPCRKP